MDAREKNESQARRREEALARRMGEALDRLSPQGAGECPDAELIAAHHERALQPDESARWEGHFAACSRCRKILAVLAASVDAPLAETEVARLGELVAAASRPSGGLSYGKGKQVPHHRIDWRARWLAPALGIAAALAVWFAMRAPWRMTGPGTSETLVAQAPKIETHLETNPQTGDRLSSVAPEQNQIVKPAPPLDRSTLKARSPNSHLEGPNTGRKDIDNGVGATSPTAGEPAGSLQENKTGALRDGRQILAPLNSPPQPISPQAKTALRTPEPATLPQVRAQADMATPRAPEVSSFATQSGKVAESAPSVETTNGTLGQSIQREKSANLPVNGRNFQALAALRPGLQYPAVLKAPSGSILWRAGKGGVIERSGDAGREWVLEKSPSQEDWLAGASVSDTVCWLVGRNGAIARTSDGEHWVLVVSPAASQASGRFPDWIWVTATDAQIATIRSSAGKSYRTQDGGQTWQTQ